MSELDDADTADLVQELFERLQKEGIDEKLKDAAAEAIDGRSDDNGDECHDCGTATVHTGGGVMTCPRCANLFEFHQILREIAVVFDSGHTFNSNKESVESLDVKERVLRLFKIPDDE